MSEPALRAATPEERRAALPTEEVSLLPADAVVLYDWLTSVDLDAVPVTHPAQRQALTELLHRLEQDVD